MTSSAPWWPAGGAGVPARQRKRAFGLPIHEYPSLAPEKLLEGDLHYNNDFRSTYATLVEKWLSLDAKPIVGGRFEQHAYLS